MFVYLAANHFPWDDRFRPDLMPEWRDPGNKPHIDEYLRRQTMSAVDYRNFVEQLKKQFPGEPFLIVRYGDHQPDFSLVHPRSRPRRCQRRRKRLTTTIRATTRPTTRSTPSTSSRCGAGGAADGRRAVSADRRAGCGRHSARSELRRAEEDHAPLQRPVLCVPRRRRGAPPQPHADRGRLRQGPVAMG